MIIKGLKIAEIDLATRKIQIFNAISFQCHHSTNCCRLNKIPVSEKEVERIRELGYDDFQFLASYTPVLLPIKGGHEKIKAYLLKKKPFSNECVFLENNLCKIHEKKPLACKTYPFSFDIIDERTLEIKVHEHSVCPSVKRENGKEELTRSIISELFQAIEQELEIYVEDLRKNRKQDIQNNQEE